MSEEEIVKRVENYISEHKWNVQGGYETNTIQALLDLYNKEKEKNIKAIEMLQEQIKHCEQESKGSLNNEICHIALNFDKHLLQELLEERN